MNTEVTVNEPTEVVESIALPPRPRAIRQGIRMNIRGRSVKLRGLRRPLTGPLLWLSILGPGLVSGSAGNDAGGIATYSSTGAKFGYDLLWVMLLVTVALAVVQEMSARLGAATGRGLLDLIRERFGIGWSLFAVGVILLANGSLVVSEFAGISAAAQLLGMSRYAIVPVAAILVWYLVVAANYSRVEKIFVAMTLVFFAYPVAAIMARPDWGAVAKGAFIPTFHRDPDYILIMVGLIGTTITPYMQLFQQSSIVEKGVARRHYGPERIDAYAGMIFSNLMSIFMIIATAATLHVAGKTDIESAADAARALQPVAGQAASTIFAVGLLGASFLAAAVLPLATAYSVSEVFGLPKGVNQDPRRARFFFRLFTALVIIGAVLVLIPGIPIIPLLLGTQVLNGIMLPVMLVFILILVNDHRLVGDLKNSRRYNIVAWTTFAVVTFAVMALLGSQLLSLFGIHIFGK